MYTKTENYLLTTVGFVFHYLFRVCKDIRYLPTHSRILSSISILTYIFNEEIILVMRNLFNNK